MVTYLLFGMDCRTPTEAALLKPSSLWPGDIQDYREELSPSLSSAREIAAKAVQKAQQCYKASYDSKLKPITYRVSDRVMVKFPADDSINFLAHGMVLTGFPQSMDRMLVFWKYITHRMEEFKFTSHIAHLTFPQGSIGMGERCEVVPLIGWNKFLLIINKIQQPILKMKELVHKKTQMI